MTFLDAIPLPAFDGLPLAVTGTRALERFSDLVDGGQAPARLRMVDRFDVMDECLDLVILRHDLPAGFEFTGLSLAEFWAVLLAVRPADAERWRTCLGGVEVSRLREAARRRVAVRPPQCFLHSGGIHLPSVYEDAPRVLLPDALADLLEAAKPGWVRPVRTRLVVETLSWRSAPGRKMPMRGRRYPAQVTTRGTWVHWHDQRLMPQGNVDAYHYAEMLLALPSLEASYFTNHFDVRNIFAHLRMTRFEDTDGRWVLLLDEVQSDWLRALRLHRQGKTIQQPRIVRGRRADQPAIKVPPCPVAGHWLDLALGAVLDYAQEWACDLIAWVPGHIQHELNPGLPLGVAQALYDRAVPRTLRRLVVEQQQTTTVEYHTYQRNLLIQHRWGKGWLLVRPDGKTLASEPVKEFETILEMYRARTIPVVEQLPAIAVESEHIFLSR